MQFIKIVDKVILRRIMKTVGDGAFRRDDLYGRSNDMGYSGALSFLRRKYTRDLTGVDVAVTGIPFDSATSKSPGSPFWTERYSYGID